MRRPGRNRGNEPDRLLQVLMGAAHFVRAGIASQGCEGFLAEVAGGLATLTTAKGAGPGDAIGDRPPP